MSLWLSTIAIGATANSIGLTISVIAIHGVNFLQIESKGQAHMSASSNPKGEITNELSAQNFQMALLRNDAPGVLQGSSQQWLLRLLFRAGILAFIIAQYDDLAKGDGRY